MFALLLFNVKTCISNGLNAMKTLAILLSTVQKFKMVNKTHGSHNKQTNKQTTDSKELLNFKHVRP